MDANVSDESPTRSPAVVKKMTSMTSAISGTNPSSATTGYSEDEEGKNVANEEEDFSSEDENKGNTVQGFHKHLDYRP